MWLCIHKYVYIMKFIQMGVVSHAWVLPKVITMLNLQYVKTEVSSDADFYIWTRIHRKSKSIQLFQAV